MLKKKLIVTTSLKEFYNTRFNKDLVYGCETHESFLFNYVQELVSLPKTQMFGFDLMMVDMSEYTGFENHAIVDYDDIKIIDHLCSLGYVFNYTDYVTLFDASKDYSHLGQFILNQMNFEITTEDDIVSIMNSSQIVRDSFFNFIVRLIENTNSTDTIGLVYKFRHKLTKTFIEESISNLYFVYAPDRELIYVLSLFFDCDLTKTFKFRDSRSRIIFDNSFDHAYKLFEPFDLAQYYKNITSCKFDHEVMVNYLFTLDDFLSHIVLRAIDNNLHKCKFNMTENRAIRVFSIYYKHYADEKYTLKNFRNSMLQFERDNWSVFRVLTIENPDEIL